MCQPWTNGWCVLVLVFIGLFSLSIRLSSLVSDAENVEKFDLFLYKTHHIEEQNIGNDYVYCTLQKNT